MATIFRGPIVTKPGVRRSLAASSQDGVTADRLTTLLKSKDSFFSGPGVGPEYDYPNPRGKRFPSDLRTFVVPVNLLLLSKDKFFYAAGEAPRYDYPNPTLRKSRFQAMTSQPQCNLLETTLASSTTKLLLRRRRMMQ